MQEAIINIVNSTIEHPEITTLIISMLPIVELRGALPWAYVFGGLTLKSAFLISIVGNFLISIPILLITPKVIELLHNIPVQYQNNFLYKFFNWVIIRARNKGGVVEKYKFWGLIIFVGIPLPITGAWTGSVAASVFNLRFSNSLVGVLFGLVMSASIVAILLLTGNWIIN
jgi:uncharacterized membrane protein